MILPFQIKKLLLQAYDFFYLKSLTPFSQEVLDGMRSIEARAISESKKFLSVGLANGKDIIEVTINNKSVELSSSTKDPFWEKMELIVLRFIRKAVVKYPKDISVKINIGLHDAYSVNLGILTFSNNSNSLSNILMPDFYAMVKYFGRFDHKDQVDFTSKKHQAIFIGSSTGKVDPEENDRLQLCNYFMNNHRVKCYINNICQIPEDAVAAAFPAYKNFLHSDISIAEQLENKFVITVDGNTAAWDRLVWILNSNSVCLKKKSDQQCWYYDLLESGKHYIEFEDFDEIEKILDTITTVQCLEIIKNANAFVQQYLTYDKHLAYMGHLLYYCSKQQT